VGDDRKNAGLMGADTRRLEEAELADVQVVFDRIEPAW
jgi:hypothetical protein